MSRTHSLLLSALLLQGGIAHADTFVRDDIITEPSPWQFSLCHDHQCATLDTVSFTAREWSTIRNLFKTKPRSAEGERTLIAKAVARFEVLAGERTGTSNDKGGDLKGLGQAGQMDCIDESINTTSYLRILEREKLLRWHTVEDRATRGWFIRGWPHTTAVVREIRSGDSYVVDSWFEDNGQLPNILPLDQWKDGWEPPTSDAASPPPKPRRSR